MPFEGLEPGQLAHPSGSLSQGFTPAFSPRCSPDLITPVQGHPFQPLRLGLGSALHLGALSTLP